MAFVEPKNINEWLILIRETASDSGSVHMTNHAQERMVERGITYIESIKCLRCGRFIEEPYQTPKGSWKFTLSYPSCGNYVDVVAAFNFESNGNNIIVITVMN